MSEEKKVPYRVLALKYRPQNFEELIGQDALVRTLKNAIESGRIAHAFMLTGVRGVGKTTTARIIAKALNYKGADGTAGPTTGDTSDCQLCQAIAEDRHPDVMEMDAASRTGVDDIREILDGVRYAPSEARYKIYIIDEVHMLSKNAFNALLKTLEEPPEHVKFIFATTEIRKVPITVLSRCQRFDLRRVDTPTLEKHFANICAQENVTGEPEALSMVARAADGSVRDGLSILDQAIALSGDKVTAMQVQDMLGLSDRARNMDLLECVLGGNVKDALSIMEELYASGADPLVVLQDLLEITHVLTKLRAVPDAGEMRQSMTSDQLKRAGDMAQKLSMPSLGKAWQILLKGCGEVQNASNPQAAAEMVIIRLSYAAELPDPADLIKKLQNGESVAAPSSPASNNPPSAPNGGGAPAMTMVKTAGGSPRAQAVAQAQPQVGMENALWADPLESLEDIVVMLDAKNEALLAAQVKQFVHLVKLEKRRIEMRLAENAPEGLTNNLVKALKEHTGEHWMISISGGVGAPTLKEQQDAIWINKVEEMKQHPMIGEILQIFPGTEITDIKER